jgi:hypothetical protein
MIVLLSVYKNRLILDTLYIWKTGGSGIGLCWRATCQEYSCGREVYGKACGFAAILTTLSPYASKNSPMS